MSSLKARIVKQLDSLPDNRLQQVLDFIEFLAWRKKTNSYANSNLKDEKLDNAWLETDLSNLGEYEPYQWQPGELEEGSSTKIDPEKGVLLIEE